MMENLEQSQPEVEKSTAESMVAIPETKPQRQLLYIILLCFLMFVLGGASVFVYFTFLKPEKVVPQTIVSPSSSPVPSPSPSPDVTVGWETYINNEVGYKVKYPEGASIEEDRGHQAKELIGKKTCVYIRWRLGYVAISTPENEEFKVNCLRTGVGYDVKDIQDTLRTAGKMYKSRGWEVMGPGETLNFHNEFHRITLENGITIEYGSALSSSASFEDYLPIKDYIIGIVESFQMVI